MRWHGGEERTRSHRPTLPDFSRHFGGAPDPPKPPPPPPVPTPADDGKAAAESRVKARKRRGPASTILTSPLGATDFEQIGQRRTLG